MEEPIKSLSDLTPTDTCDLCRGPLDENTILNKVHVVCKDCYANAMLLRKYFSEVSALSIICDKINDDSSGTSK